MLTCLNRSLRVIQYKNAAPQLIDLRKQPVLKLSTISLPRRSDHDVRWWNGSPVTLSMVINVARCTDMPRHNIFSTSTCASNCRLEMKSRSITCFLKYYFFFSRGSDLWFILPFKAFRRIFTIFVNKSFGFISHVPSSDWINFIYCTNKEL